MVCTHCKVEKELSEYYPSSLKTSTHWCKLCMNGAARSWSSRNEDKVNAIAKRSRVKNREKRNEVRKWQQIFNKYGITKDQYVVLLAHQEHCCPICDSPLVNMPRISVDHNHQTGKVRGILCNNCNRGIGLLKDNSAVLQRAAAYLS